MKGAAHSRALNTKDVDTRQQLDNGECLRCTGCIGYVEHCNWRKICQHCRCPFEAHKVSEGHMSKLASDFQRQCGSASDNDSGCALEEYAWVPQGLRPEQVHQYFNSLHEDRIPFIGSAGEKYRTEQLVWQLPAYDSDIRYCQHLAENEKKEHIEFNTHRKREALGRGTVRQLPVTLNSSACTKCNQPIVPGEIAVFAARAGAHAQWHPQCFVCRVCEEQLVDLIYFHQEGSLYCGRHFGELQKPRCASCDEIIFSDECTEAENLCWHMKHFSCFDCNLQLGGKRYVMKGAYPYCCDCFERKFADFCVTCGGQIGVDQGQMKHEGQHWHATEACFRCATCDRVLLGIPFLPKNGTTYCSIDCSRGMPSFDSANDSLKSNSTAAEHPTHERHKFEDPWVLRDAVPRENYSEGYGSLQKANELCRRSLPDLTTCEEYTDNEESCPPLPPKTRAGSVRNLGRLTNPPQKQPKAMTPKQKCVKWANEQSLLTQSPASDVWPISPVADIDYNARRIISNTDLQSVRPKVHKPEKLPPSLQKIVGIASTSSLVANQDSKPSTRKHRTKRMSRSQRERLSQRRSAAPAPPPVEERAADSSCSTCTSSSSGEESDLDDAYQADIIRSGGLRMAYADNKIISPAKAMPMCRARRAKQRKTKNCSVQ